MADQGLERVEVNGLVYYRSARWQGVTHGVFTRRGGVSPAPWDGLNLGGNVGDSAAAVRENHLRMYGALGVEDARACTVWQVHSADVLVVDQPLDRPPEERWIAKADGMITNNPDVVLSMRFADCVPLLFYDRVRCVIGISHAGWRGTVQGIGAATVRLMTATYGSRPADIEAMIGPSISLSRFQVGDEVVAALHDYFGDTDGLMRRDQVDGSAYVDLWAANRRDLERAGVEQVTVMGMCTASNTDEWFSHRAEHGKTGRFGVVMQLA